MTKATHTSVSRDLLDEIAESLDSLTLTLSGLIEMGIDNLPNNTDCIKSEAAMRAARRYAEDIYFATQRISDITKGGAA